MKFEGYKRAFTICYYLKLVSFLIHYFHVLPWTASQCYDYGISEMLATGRLHG